MVLASRSAISQTKLSVNTSPVFFDRVGRIGREALVHVRMTFEYVFKKKSRWFAFTAPSKSCPLHCSTSPLAGSVKHFPSKAIKELGKAYLLLA